MRRDCDFTWTCRLQGHRYRVIVRLFLALVCGSGTHMKSDGYLSDEFVHGPGGGGQRGHIKERNECRAVRQHQECLAILNTHFHRTPIENKRTTKSRRHVAHEDTVMIHVCFGRRYAEVVPICRAMGRRWVGAWARGRRRARAHQK